MAVAAMIAQLKAELAGVNRAIETMEELAKSQTLNTTRKPKPGQTVRDWQNPKKKEQA
jgi:hypothetical protein